MVVAKLQRKRIKPIPYTPLLTKRSIGKSKLSKPVGVAPPKEESKVQRREFDMTCAGHILYYPDFEGLPIREGSKMTPEAMKNTLDAANARGGWVSFYVGEPWYHAEIKTFYCDYKYCHAGIKSPPFPKTFLLDVINWGVVGAKAAVMTDKMHKMLISKDSPWADALTNVYFLMNKDTGRLLGMYVRDMEKDIPPELRRLFVNFLIAIRALSEHRENRKAMEKAKPETHTLLGWFVFVSLELPVWHNWYSNGTLGKKWLTSLFQKKHSNEGYDRTFSNMCNRVYGPVGDTSVLSTDVIKEVEKELGYAD